MRMNIGELLGRENDPCEGGKLICETVVRTRAVLRCTCRKYTLFYQKNSTQRLTVGHTATSAKSSVRTSRRLSLSLSLPSNLPLTQKTHQTHPHPNRFPVSHSRIPLWHSPLFLPLIPSHTLHNLHRFLSLGNPFPLHTLLLSFPPFFFLNLTR